MCTQQSEVYYTGYETISRNIGPNLPAVLMETVCHSNCMRLKELGNWEVTGQSLYCIERQVVIAFPIIVTNYGKEEAASQSSTSIAINIAVKLTGSVQHHYV